MINIKSDEFRNYLKKCCNWDSIETVFHDSTFLVACKDKLIYISSFSSENNFLPKKGLVFDMVSGQTLEAEGY
jgi:hypothetical protein